MCNLYPVTTVGLLFLAILEPSRSVFGRDSSPEDRVVSEYSKALVIMEKNFAQSRISGVFYEKNYKYSKNHSGELVYSKPKEQLRKL